MKQISRSLIAIAAMVCGGAQAAPLLDLSDAGYYTYGNTNSYSLPVAATVYDYYNGGGVGPGNPFYVRSTPGAIQDLVVVYTGASGTGVNTNADGFDNAYQAPNGSSPQFASIDGSVNMTSPGNKAGIANNDAQTWDASLLSLKTFLNNSSLIFLFNNNDTNADQNLAIWGKLWLTDGSGNVYDNRYLYLSNEGAAYGAGGVPSGDATIYNPGNITNPATGFGASDYVLSGGNVTTTLPDGSTTTLNHNLGANQAAYAGSLPVLDQWLTTLFALSDTALDQYTLHLDVRLGCTTPGGWSTCDNVKIDNGFEQLFIGTATLDNGTTVPEPAGIALTGLALGALGFMSRRRRS